ncbi:MAG TPA: hypothetical protein IGS53_23840 [Leptolyngbyaceae cyanobacterium M33_DOE_097]|uniref:Uncharacterized protein n=1 Tax=Oscillatoriales cyanobacterium SpSt-418 TaxID=2282169 RepID=A0A7C3KGX0_9CYAN|nr:hypothetical protein [Leptolyngbyaceae cyanobacterium M33_DOE_097]
MLEPPSLSESVSQPIPPLAIAPTATNLTISQLATYLPRLGADAATDPSEYYLGLHLGSDALVAVLLDPATQQMQPLGALHWRSPMTSALMPAPDTAPLTVGTTSEATLIEQILSYSPQYLNSTIPFYCPQTLTWQPELQWSATQKITLHQLRQKLTGLLMSLDLQPWATGATAADSSLTNVALGGVFVSRSIGYAEAYELNQREAILAAGLVRSPEQIYFVEGAIAALLAEATPTPALTPTDAVQRGTVTNLREGPTLLVLMEAAATELLLVDLPTDLTQLRREDCHLRELKYGTNALEQDIICQLIYPVLQRSKQLALRDRPLPGEPDLALRAQLMQQLNNHALGDALATVARRVRDTLCRQPSVSIHMSGQAWQITEAELDRQVLQPYLAVLNRELNPLLSQTGVDAAAVRQVICVGEIAQNQAVCSWLKQKLPNTTLIRPNRALANSTVARGLALTGCYPAMLDATRHQYSDLFLLQELLTVVPDTPLSLGQIFHRLERRGVNTNACQRTLLHLLEGHLPPSLLPQAEAQALLTLRSLHHGSYQALRAIAPFTKDNNQYRLNPTAKDTLLRHLETIFATTPQSLEEPLPFGLPIVPTSHASHSSRL